MAYGRQTKMFLLCLRRFTHFCCCFFVVDFGCQVMCVGGRGGCTRTLSLSLPHTHPRAVVFCFAAIVSYRCSSFVTKLDLLVRLRVRRNTANASLALLFLLLPFIFLLFFFITFFVFVFSTVSFFVFSTVSFLWTHQKLLLY